MWQDINVSEGHAASIFRVKQRSPPKRWYPTTSLDFDKSQEDYDMNVHCRGNLKCRTSNVLFLFSNLDITAFIFIWLYTGQRICISKTVFQKEAGRRIEKAA
jgi:hypothetical protein